jgi:molybdenum cofactor cytidylyltransferase
MPSDALPVVTTVPEGVSREAEVLGVVLAAGESHRFGDRNKLLATVDGEPLVRQAVRTLLHSAVDEVVVVVGHEADRVVAALDGLDVTIRENDRHAEGQSTSVRDAALAARERGVDALLVALGDMPFVDSATVDVLLDAYGAALGDAIAAAYEGNRGNPVLFDACFFDELASVDGDVGGKHILRHADGSVAIATGDPGVVHDIDRPRDLPDRSGP